MAAARYWDLNRDNPHMYTRADLFPDPREIHDIRNCGDYEMLAHVYQSKIKTLITLLTANSGISAGTGRPFGSSAELRQEGILAAPSSLAKRLAAVAEPGPTGPEELCAMMVHARKCARKLRCYPIEAGKERADPAIFFKCLVDLVRREGKGVPWCAFSLRKAYRREHPNHVGYHSWIGNPGGNGVIFSVEQILKEAFPDVADTELVLPKKSTTVKRKARSFDLKQLCTFVVDEILAKWPAPLQSFETTCKAIEKAAHDKWPMSKRLKLWTRVGLPPASAAATESLTRTLSGARSGADLRLVTDSDGT